MTKWYNLSFIWFGNDYSINSESPGNDWAFTNSNSSLSNGKSTRSNSMTPSSLTSNPLETVAVEYLTHGKAFFFKSQS